MDNKTTDNFAEPMYATKESVISLFTDIELKEELQKRGYKEFWIMIDDSKESDYDLGSGL